MLDVVATTPSSPLGACRLVRLDMAPRWRFRWVYVAFGAKKQRRGNILLYAQAAGVSKGGEEGRLKVRGQKLEVKSHPPTLLSNRMLFRPKRGSGLAQDLLLHLFADRERFELLEIPPDLGNAGAWPVRAKKRFVSDLTEPRKIVQ